jgi:GT2 family glycosyltransferase
MVKISVVIANYNGEKYIEQCLRSIYKDRGQYEVIVVDDQSVDNSLKILSRISKRYKNLRLYHTPKKAGSTGTRNLGAHNARGNYLLFLDLDTTIKKGWYTACLHFFKKNPKAGIAQPKILIMGTEKYDYAGDYFGPFGFLIERSEAAKDRGQFDQEDKIFSMKGAGILTKKKIFNQVGGFDNDFEYMWEEPDYAWRVWLAGYEVLFLPSVTVWHAYGKKGKDYYIAADVYYRGARNTIMSLLKNLGLYRLLYILPINMGCWIVLSVLFILKLDWKKGSAIVRGLLWNVIHIYSTLKKRYLIQKKRKLSDTELFSMVGSKRSITYYMHKAKTYVWN